MQVFFQLSDGSYLKLTMAQFAGPTATAINELGVSPHIETTGNALYKAHYDTIVEQYPQYKELSSLHNVPTTKTFTLNFNNIINIVPTGAIELVQLGKNSVDITIKKQGSTLSVTPTQPLVSGTQYMLIIHPTIKGSTNNVLKKGSYLHITVT